MSWIWPPDSSPQQKEIAAFLRFDQWTFSSDLNHRGNSIQRFWNSNHFVSVPLPNRIGTDLNMDYTTNSARISSDRNFGRVAGHPLNVYPGTLFDPDQTTNQMNLRLPGKDFTQAPDANNDDHINHSFLDIIDTTWLGQSRRVYSFDIFMHCKSIPESNVAASICNWMNAGALPRLSSINSSDIIGNQRASHPAMWAIHVRDSGNRWDSATAGWLGEFPQLCVLQKVQGMRIGGSENQVIGMISSTLSGFVPIVYNLKLIFVELEPVYIHSSGRNSTSRSRSQFII